MSCIIHQCVHVLHTILYKTIFCVLILDIGFITNLFTSKLSKAILVDLILPVISSKTQISEFEWNITEQIPDMAPTTPVLNLYHSNCAF